MKKYAFWSQNGNNHETSTSWSHTGRRRQEDCQEFKANLVRIVNSMSVWAIHQDSVSKKWKHNQANTQNSNNSGGWKQQLRTDSGQEIEQDKGGEAGRDARKWGKQDQEQWQLQQHGNRS